MTDWQTAREMATQTTWEGRNRPARVRAIIAGAAFAGALLGLFASVAAGVVPSPWLEHRVPFITWGLVGVLLPTVAFAVGGALVAASTD